MPSKAKTITEYLKELTPVQRISLTKLRTAIKNNLPEGFREVMNYGMIGYVVPHTIYPKGYRCTPDLPLPFMNLAAQKNCIALYHMGLYMNAPLMQWFVAEYTKQFSKKPDMGKSCIRFKKAELIPLELIGQLSGKITVKDWITMYEKCLVQK